MENEKIKLVLEPQPEEAENKIYVDASVLDEEPSVDIENSEIPVHPLYTSGVNYGSDTTSTTQPVDNTPVYTGTVENTGVPTTATYTYSYNSQTANKAPASSQSGYDTALGSLIVGIVGIIVAFIPVIAFVGAILGVVGIVLSVSAKGKGFKGGIAVGGLVTSIIAIAIVALKVVSCMACLASM